MQVTIYKNAAAMALISPRFAAALVRDGALSALERLLEPATAQEHRLAAAGRGAGARAGDTLTLLNAACMACFTAFASAVQARCSVGERAA